jgi:hypothetical protein
MPEYATPSSDQSILGALVNKIGSADWSKWQIQRWQYYDFVRCASAAASTTTLSFFTTPQGGADPVSATVKTLEQTNMTKSSTFGQVYFIIQQIRTQLRPLVKARQTANTLASTVYSLDQLTISQRLRTAFSTGLLNLAIGQKGYFDIIQPFRNAPPGFGLGSNTVVVPFSNVNAAAALGNAYLEQSNNLADVYNLSPPQLVEPEQTFQCQIQFPDLGYNFSACLVNNGENAYVEAGVIFDGFLARPVQ